MFENYVPALTYEFVKHLQRVRAESAVRNAVTLNTLSEVQTRIGEIDRTTEALATCLRRIDEWDIAAQRQLQVLAKPPAAEDGADLHRQLVDFRRQLAQQRSATDELLRALGKELDQLQVTIQRMIPKR